MMLKLRRMGSRVVDAWYKAKAMVTAPLFIGVPGNRSDSDDGQYVKWVKACVDDPRKFSRFKTHPAYQRILEHVGYELGQQYLDIVRRDNPGLLGHLEGFKRNDVVGRPDCFAYEGVGRISPTTLRYMKVASDIVRLFGDDLGRNVAEIGVGYGGQLLVLDEVCTLGTYHMFDLLPVLRLAEQYLECHLLRGSYQASTLNQFAGEEAFDLVISNYAFSELPAPLQRLYIEKVMVRSKRGYLTMNSGMGTSYHDTGKLSLTELKELLPAFEIMEEEPATGTGTYIVVWGHKRKH